MCGSIRSIRSSQAVGQSLFWRTVGGGGDSRQKSEMITQNTFARTTITDLQWQPFSKQDNIEVWNFITSHRRRRRLGSRTYGLEWDRGSIGPIVGSVTGSREEDANAIIDIRNYQEFPIQGIASRMNRAVCSQRHPIYWHCTAENWIARQNLRWRRKMELDETLYLTLLAKLLALTLMMGRRRKDLEWNWEMGWKRNLMS